MTDIAEQRRQLAQAIAQRKTLHIEMGTAHDSEMTEVPWRGFIAPTGFRKSAQGERVCCDTKPEQLYLVVTAEQGGGPKRLLIGDFTILGETTRKIDFDTDLYLSI